MKKIFLPLLFITLLGCAPTLEHATIKEFAAKVNRSDGIDRIEATLIAQDFIIRRSLYDRLVSLDPYRATRRVAFYKDSESIVYVIVPEDRTGITVERTWEFLFRDRRYTYYHMPVSPFFVVVNEDTGEILDWGIKNLRDDKDIYSYVKVYEREQL